MPFRFLVLPDLAQHVVLHNMRLHDRLAFSMISRKTKAILKDAKTTIHSLKWCFSRSADNILTLELIDRELSLLHTPLRQYWSGTRKIGDFGQLPCFRFDNHWYLGPCGGSETHGIEILEQISEAVFDIFRIQNCHLEASDLTGAAFVTKFTNVLKSMKVAPGNYAEYRRIVDAVRVEDLRYY